MTPGAAQALIRLRESGYVPRSGNEFRQLLPFASGSGTQADRQRFDRLTTYTTNEVEIISEGRVEGSPIRVEARVVVGRSNSGAVVLWRRVEW
jgi:hypothetical protein